MTGVVIDAGVALAWIYPDKDSTSADSILASLEYETVVVPANWSVEVADALAAGLQLGNLTAAGVQRFVRLLERLDIVEYACEPMAAVGRRVSLCTDHGLTGQDAAYLDIAMREKLPLATFERTLRHAAGNTGVKLFAPPDDA